MCGEMELLVMIVLLSPVLVPWLILGFVQCEFWL
jgi:hypothetical protein